MEPKEDRQSEDFVAPNGDPEWTRAVNASIREFEERAKTPFEFILQDWPTAERPPDSGE